MAEYAYIVLMRFVFLCMSVLPNMWLFVLKMNFPLVLHYVKLNLLYILDTVIIKSCFKAIVDKKWCIVPMLFKSV